MIAGTILLDSLAYGMILFIISVGLTVTMGLMRVANLAHGAFAMVGGYVAARLTGVGFAFGWALLAAALVPALIGAAAERTIYRPIYRKGDLAQVLMTFGLTFVAVAGLTAIFGPKLQVLQLPPMLQGSTDLGFRTYPTYRLFVIGVGLAIALALWLLIERTGFGARLRAAVDNPRIARAMGIDVDRLFTLTFAGGCALAGFGGAIGAEMLPLEPYYAIRYLVVFLVVVSVGGLGSFKGSFIAALLLALVDTTGKYLLPQVAAFLFYGTAIALLLWRPGGLSPHVPTATRPAPRLPLTYGEGGRLVHLVPWIAALGVYFAFPDYLGLGTNVLAMILFAMSLDLALGYAGILTFGHAAFFGIGGYGAALFAAHVMPDPVMGLLVGTAVAGVAGLVVGALILHTEGITLLMLTLGIVVMLGEAGQQVRGITGGDDGMAVENSAVFGRFRFDMYGHTAYLYALAVLFFWFVVNWRLVASPFGRTLDGIRQNPRRMQANGTPVWRRRVVAFAISSAMAGSAGAISAQTTQFVGLTAVSVLMSGTVLVMLVLGGTRTRYGAFVGATVYTVVQNFSAEIDPFYWMFVIGGLLMLTVLLLEGGLVSLVRLAPWSRRATSPIPEQRPEAP